MFAIGETSSLWTVDSACNVNIMKEARDMSDLTPYETLIQVGNGETMSSTHKGTIIIPNTNIKLTALLCPKAIRPLISVNKLVKEKFAVSLRETDGEISKGSIVIPLLAKNGFWVFAKYQANLATRASNNLIHRRLGHLSTANMKYLLNPQNKLLREYKTITTNSDCPVCVEANLKVSKSGARDYTQANKILEIVHTDLAGPMSIPTTAGALYYCTFTDDKTRYVKIYLLQNKSDAIEAFNKYHAYSTSLHQVPLIRIHSDLGSEFFNNHWKQFCEQKGITQTSAPRNNPNQNAIPEVCNRIIMTKARAMMNDANLPRNLWGYAVQTASLLKNISPTAVHGRTPFELWHKRKPTLQNLRVWGTLAYFKQTTTKIENKARKGIFLGYDELCPWCRTFPLVVQIFVHPSLLIKNTPIDAQTFIND